MPVDTEGATSPLMEQAELIGELQSPEDRATETKPAAPAEPNIGSYEAFLSTLGNPRRWAGR